jgi:DNA-binding SARP family transcriptional activator
MGGIKPRQILEILALNAGAPVAKDKLADLLWDGKPPASYVGTLESYVCVLRRSLGLAGGRRSVLATTPNGYRLDPDCVSVDLVEFGRLVARGSMDAATYRGRVEEALRLVRGELLADEPYAAWADRARECFRRDIVAACVHASGLAHAAGDAADAVRLARVAVDHDPSAEEAVQHLMRALWLADRRCEALQRYAEMRQTMLDDIGAEPGTESRDLYLAILRDTPATGPGTVASTEMEIKTLLRLLRQVLEAMPGVGPPASDAALTGFALNALAGVA